MKRILLLSLIYFICFSVSKGQDDKPVISSSKDWTIWEEIYNYKGLVVEISFSLFDCDSTQKQSKFKYQVTGNLLTGEKYLNWKMKYLNCDNEIVIQQNSLDVGEDADDGIIESMDDRFICKSLEKMYYDVKISTVSKARKDVSVIIPSKDPISISGLNTIYRNQSTTLQVEGGQLGTDAEWVWFKDNCGKQAIGNGYSITVQPSETTTYFVKAVSKQGQTNCAQTTVSVNQNSTQAIKILGNDYVCRNGSTELSLSGGSLGLGAEWVWYENNCEGSPIGKGNPIKVYPKKSTVYFARAEGSLNKTPCVSFETKVVNISDEPVSILNLNSNTVCEGTDVTLKVNGGALAEDAEWFWYSGSCSYGIQIGKGNSITFSPSNSNSYFVRAEGKCNITNCAKIEINVDKKAVAAYGIKSPDVIYKNKKITLEVDKPLRTPVNTIWQWYKVKCETGKKIGTGPSISIKPKKDETYLVRAENNCSTSECVELNITPKKSHKFHPTYTVKGYEKKFLHIGIGIGLEGGYVSALANSTFQNASVITNSIEVAKISSTGLKTEFVFHPFIKDYFGIGIISSFSIGTTPYFITGGKKNGGAEKIKYLYTKFDLGTEMTFGFKPVKLLVAYKSSIQTHKFNHTSSEGSGITTLNFNRQIRKDFIIAGFRFGAYKQKTSKRSICYDVTYNLTRDYAWDWSKFNWNFKAISNWQHGIGFGMWVHSILKFQIDAAIDSRLGSFSPSKYDNLYLGFSIMYNRNAFY
jgi:hypothetical protein